MLEVAETWERLADQEEAQDLRPTGHSQPRRQVPNSTVLFNIVELGTSLCAARSDLGAGQGTARHLPAKAKDREATFVGLVLVWDVENDWPVGNGGPWSAGDTIRSPRKPNQGSLLLGLRKGRGVVMGNSPDAVALRHEHCETSGKGGRLSILYHVEFVKAGDDNGPVVHDDCSPVANSILAAASLEWGKIAPYCASALRHDWA
jgi:hypothetical protein